MSNQRIFISKKTTTQTLEQRRKQRPSPSSTGAEPSQDDLKLPMALLAVFICIAILLFIVRQVDPLYVADWFIPNSYLPVLIVVFAGSISGLYCFFLELKRPILWACCITLIIWLKFQGLLGIQSLMFFLTPFVLTQLVMWWLGKNEV